MIVPANIGIWLLSTYFEDSPYPVESTAKQKKHMKKKLQEWLRFIDWTHLKCCGNRRRNQTYRAPNVGYEHYSHCFSTVRNVLRSRSLTSL